MVQRNRRTNNASLKDTTKKVDPENVSLKINSTRSNSLSRRKELSEMLSRMSQNDILDIIQSIGSYNNLYDFFRDYSVKRDPAELVALNILTENELELFRFLDEKNYSNEISQGKIEIYNKDIINNERQRRDFFISEHPKYNTKLQNSYISLPKVYILGNENDLAFVEAMSLETTVKPIFNKSDLDVFKKDNSEKVVLIFKSPNSNLSTEYQEIKVQQNFKSFITFDFDGVPESGKIVPFNRNKVINKLIG